MGPVRLCFLRYSFCDRNSIGKFHTQWRARSARRFGYFSKVAVSWSQAVGATRVCGGVFGGVCGPVFLFIDDITIGSTRNAVPAWAPSIPNSCVDRRRSPCRSGGRAAEDAAGGDLSRLPAAAAERSTHRIRPSAEHAAPLDPQGFGRGCGAMPRVRSRKSPARDRASGKLTTVCLSVDSVTTVAAV